MMTTITNTPNNIRASKRDLSFLLCVHIFFILPPYFTILFVPSFHIVNITPGREALPDYPSLLNLCPQGALHGQQGWQSQGLYQNLPKTQQSAQERRISYPPCNHLSYFHCAEIAYKNCLHLADLLPPGDLKGDRVGLTASCR